VQIREPEPLNILTAMAENESVVKQESDGERKAIVLAWHSGEFWFTQMGAPAVEARLIWFGPRAGNIDTAGRVGSLIVANATISFKVLSSPRWMADKIKKQLVRVLQTSTRS
jgi:hypothetical protein